MSTEVTQAPRGGARERLLAAANELFYAEGVHTVGIDRIIERAGVAKASLYNTFGSKDQLIVAYLETRRERNRARIEKAVARYEDPRERLLAVFEAAAEIIADPSFRGCAFVNASAEAPPDCEIEKTATEYRRWLRSLMVDLARAAGVRDAESFSRRMRLLFDGAMLSARLDREAGAAEAARAVVEIMLDAALAA